MYSVTLVSVHGALWVHKRVQLWAVRVILAVSLAVYRVAMRSSAKRPMEMLATKTPLEPARSDQNCVLGTFGLSAAVMAKPMIMHVKPIELVRRLLQTVLAGRQSVVVLLMSNALQTNTASMPRPNNAALRGKPAHVHA